MQSEHAYIYGGHITLALINAGLAENKNRSRLCWFFASLFLGPIATFLLVAICDKLDETTKLTGSKTRC